VQPHDFLADITGMPSDILISRLTLVAVFALGFSITGLLFALLTRWERNHPPTCSDIRPVVCEAPAPKPAGTTLAMDSVPDDQRGVRRFLRLKGPKAGEWFDAETGERLPASVSASLDADLMRIMDTSPRAG
jgi:hypothetical protein